MSGCCWYLDISKSCFFSFSILRLKLFHCHFCLSSKKSLDNFSDVVFRSQIGSLSQAHFRHWWCNCSTSFWNHCHWPGGGHRIWGTKKKGLYKFFFLEEVIESSVFSVTIYCSYVALAFSFCFKFLARAWCPRHQEKTFGHKNLLTKMGCTNCTSAKSMGGSPAMESLGKIMKEFPVRMPSLPGDVIVSGDLPMEVVDQLAAYCKGWLYVNPESDPHFMGDTIKSKGTNLKVLPFKPAKDLSASVVDELVTLISELPRPLMIQCTSANRAGIALLLWMAREFGYSQGCAEMLVKDLCLDTVKPEAQQWLQSRLPAVGHPEPLIHKSPEVRQLYDEESSTFTYLLSCPDTSEAVLIDPVLEHKDRDLKCIKDGFGQNRKWFLLGSCRLFDWYFQSFIFCSYHIG